MHELLEAVRVTGMLPPDKGNDKDVIRVSLPQIANRIILQAQGTLSFEPRIAILGGYRTVDRHSEHS